MADPGFPRGGGANSPGGAPTYDFAKFSQKVHEIERIWTPGGGARPKFYVDPPPIQWRIQDFPEEGAPTLQGGRQHTILPNFPKNCMKLKEFGPGGARVQNFTM